MAPSHNLPSIIKDAASTKVKTPSEPEGGEEIKLLSPSVAAEMQLEQIQELPANKRWPFDVGPLVLSVNAGLVGVISNSFFRRMLMIRKGLFLTSLPLALMPALIMTPAWMALVTRPILLGDLKCGICADIRGGLINFMLGAIYPIVLAAPLSAALARRYETVKVPPLAVKQHDRIKFINFWAGKLRYFKTQFIAITFFQTCFGMYVASSQIAVMRNDVNKDLHKL